MIIRSTNRQAGCFKCSTPIERGEVRVNVGENYHVDCYIEKTVKQLMELAAHKKCSIDELLKIYRTKRVLEAL